MRNRCVVEDGIEHCLINCDKSHNCPTWYVLCTITFLSYVSCLGPALRNLALFYATTLINIHTYLQGGSVAEWLACWTRAILPLTLYTHTCWVLHNQARCQKLNRGVSPLPLPSIFSSPVLFSPFSLRSRAPPQIAASGSGGALKLPQRVRVEPGRQMYFNWTHKSCDIFGCFLRSCYT